MADWHAHLCSGLYLQVWGYVPGVELLEHNSSTFALLREGTVSTHSAFYQLSRCMPGLQLTHILSGIFCLPFHTSIFKLFMITSPFQCRLELEIPVPLYGLCFLLEFIEDKRQRQFLRNLMPPGLLLSSV